MEIVHLMIAAAMPFIKVLLITAVGIVLALDRVDILGELSRKNLNKLVYYVFNPALCGSSLAETMTFSSLRKLWFMPLNVLLINIVGTAFGWILLKLTRAPKELRGVIIVSCSAGNLSLTVIIIPAMCKKGGPFGSPEVCHTNGMAYASLSMALGAIIFWAYSYNIVRMLTVERRVTNSKEDNNARPQNLSVNLDIPENEANNPSNASMTLSQQAKLRHWISKTSKEMHLTKLLSPTTIAVILGFFLGTISPIKHVLIGDDAILHVLNDSVYMIGDAAVPAMLLILGASLLQGLNGSKIKLSIVIGTIVVRYIFLPGLGFLIVRGAVHVGIIDHDPLFMYVLLFQHVVPPAMSISTITEMFESGDNEGSVILLWTYALAPIFLTLWSAFYLWVIV
ncbi:hypothetical protein BVRB_2g040480 [Beta vulgaris subsp. vulgaris]|nr:hypothetical protein BVRB_2g040480 [Beta vulgaris subsp. vulgaris]